MQLQEYSPKQNHSGLEINTFPVHIPVERKEVIVLTTVAAFPHALPTTLPLLPKCRIDQDWLVTNFLFRLCTVSTRASRKPRPEVAADT